MVVYDVSSIVSKNRNVSDGKLLPWYQICISKYSAAIMFDELTNIFHPQPAIVHSFKQVLQVNIFSFPYLKILLGIVFVFYQGKVSSNSPVIPLQITLNHLFAQSPKEQCVTREKSGRFLKVALLE